MKKLDYKIVMAVIDSKGIPHPFDMPDDDRISTAKREDYTLIVRHKYDDSVWAGCTRSLDESNHGMWIYVCTMYEFEQCKSIIKHS